MAKSDLTEKCRVINDRLNGRSIVLVGLMGAGKTSIGRRLGEVLKLEFVDADSEIERAADMTIAELFETKGETYFRTGERKVIERLLREGPKVIATGGGAYMNEQARSHITQAGISVWLKADLDLLWKRVRGRKHRPLLLADNAKEILANLMQQRYPTYALADITLTTFDGPHARIVEKAVETIADYLETQDISPSKGSANG